MKFDPGDDNAPAGTWQISNQLNDYKFETWTIGKPKILLLPAAKAEPDEKLPGAYPKEKDHYLCYAVENGTAIDVDIALTDQIDDKFKKEDTTESDRGYYQAYAEIHRRPRKKGGCRRA
jgi:hypothetical protein